MGGKGGVRRCAAPAPVPAARTHLRRLEQLRRVGVARHVLLRRVGDAPAQQLGHGRQHLAVVDAARRLPRHEHARPQAQRAEGRERGVAAPPAARLCQQLQCPHHRHRYDVVLRPRVAR